MLGFLEVSGLILDMGVLEFTNGSDCLMFTWLGPNTKQKAKPRSEDDDDDWRGDSDGEKELLSARKRPVPRKKDVQTRSQNLATSSETIVDPRKKRKMVSTSDMQHPSIEEKDSKASKRRTASTSTKKTSKKRKPRASESEEEEDDDDGEDLDGFLVDDAEEEEEEVTTAVYLHFILFYCTVWYAFFRGKKMRSFSLLEMYITFILEQYWLSTLCHYSCIVVGTNYIIL